MLQSRSLHRFDDLAVGAVNDDGIEVADEPFGPATRGRERVEELSELDLAMADVSNEVWGLHRSLRCPGLLSGGREHIEDRCDRGYVWDSSPVMCSGLLCALV